jgi:hypothetical protein
MIAASRILVLLAGAGLLSQGQLAAAEPIPPHDFAKLHALIKPGPGEEKWNRIPWLASLWEARQRAAAEGKPILLWEMDGNPLGCT